MFKNTVSKIVGDLERKCQLLAELAADLRAAAEQKHADAQQLQKERDDHYTDADHAERVAAKVKSLLD